MMKKSLFFAAAALAFAACSQDTTEDVAVVNSSKGRIYVEYASSGDTRTSMDSNGDIKWSVGDVLGVMSADQTNVNVPFVYTGEETDENGKTVAVFEGDLDLLTELEEGGYMAYYPYDVNATITENTEGYSCIAMTIPAVQNYVANSFANQAAPAVGYSEDPSHFTLKGVGTYIGVPIIGYGTVNSLTLAIDGVDLAATGSVSYQFGEEKDSEAIPALEASGSEASSITLNCGKGQTLSLTEEKYFYFVVPANIDMKDKQITVTVNGATDGMTRTFETEEDEYIFEPNTRYTLSSQNGKNAYWEANMADLILVQTAEELLEVAYRVAGISVDEKSGELSFDKNAVDDLENMTVLLMNDLDLTDKEFFPIGAIVFPSDDFSSVYRAPFKGTFCSNGNEVYTISGLKFDAQSAAYKYAPSSVGLFGLAEGVSVHDIAIDKASFVAQCPVGIWNVSDTKNQADAVNAYAGVVAAQATGTFENISVTNSSVQGQGKTAGFIGSAWYVEGFSAKKCSVDNVTVTLKSLDDKTGERGHAAAFLGFLRVRTQNVKISECTVKNSQVVTVGGGIDPERTCAPFIGAIQNIKKDTGSIINLEIADCSVENCSVPTESETTEALPKAYVEDYIGGFYKNDIATYGANVRIFVNGWSIWSGAADAVTNGVIASAENLAWVAQNVPATDATTYKVTTDIDLCGLDWTNYNNANHVANQTKISIDGQKHTIKNLTSKAAGMPDEETTALSANTIGYPSLLGCVNGTIENLTLENVTLEGAHVKVGSRTYTSQVGAVASAAAGTMSNVTVKNVKVGMTYDPEVVLSAYSYVGGLCGTFSGTEISGSTVSDASLEGYGEVGGVIGRLAGTSATKLTDVKAEKVAVEAAVGNQEDYEKAADFNTAANVFSGVYVGRVYTTSTKTLVITGEATECTLNGSANDVLIGGYYMSNKTTGAIYTKINGTDKNYVMSLLE